MDGEAGAGSAPEDWDVLVKKLRDKRRQLGAFNSEFETRGGRLTNVGIVTSAVATLLAAAPAVGGLKLTEALGSMGSNSPSWRILCALAAVCSLLATIATNMFRTQDIATKLAKAQACDAKLEGLAMLVELKQLSLKEATTRFEQCLPDVAFINSAQGSVGELDAVEASIKQPADGRMVEANFECSGYAAGVRPNLHLWLAVEIDGRLWPKEGEILVRPDGSWSKTIFEEGHVDAFSLSLWVVNATGNKSFRNWLKESDRAGTYVGLRRSAGMQRLDRVGGLHRALVH